MVKLHVYSPEHLLRNEEEIDLCVAFVTTVTDCSFGQAVGKSPIWEDRILAVCDLVGSVLKLEFLN